MTRRMMAGTGWKMNMTVAQTRAYAQALGEILRAQPADELDIFVLPPFTSLHAAHEALAGTPVAHGGQNMHWDSAGAWTGEISAPMLVEAGCRYVELAHSERLACFNETYEFVRRKVNAALATGLMPILCLGETAADREAGRADAVLAEQLRTAVANVPSAEVSQVVFAYEPRWAIGATDSAPPAYVADRHGALRETLRRDHGAAVAQASRIIYGGSVNAANGAALAAVADVDGLFVGRAAWTPQGLANIIRIVQSVAQQRAHT